MNLIRASRLMLQVRTLTRAFRGLVAVKDVSFDVENNEIVALIGPNGAGKTTCFNMIAGAHESQQQVRCCLMVKSSPGCRRSKLR